MARLAELSYREGTLLLAFEAHVHFRRVKGWSRVRTRIDGYSVNHALVYFARARRLFDLGLVATGTVEGRDAAVLTPAGKAMAETIRAVRARQAARAPAPPPAERFWWQDR